MLHPDTESTLRRSSAEFHCPWGHPQHFPLGESQETILRRERDRLKQMAAQLSDTITAERDRANHAERRVAAVRGVVTKLKKRAANGVCPCCTRTFVDLRRHMASKHAGFAVEVVESE